MPSWRGKVHFTFLPFSLANITITSRYLSAVITVCFESFAGRQFNIWNFMRNKRGWSRITCLGI